MRKWRRHRRRSGRVLLRPIVILGLAGLLGATQSSASVDDDAIVRAAKDGDWAVVRDAVEHGADVNAAPGDGTTALHWASYRGNLETVDLLIRVGADANAASDLGVTPLWLTSERGDIAIARRLLDAGSDPNAALLSGETAVMTAARAGHAKYVTLLLSAGADPNARALRGQTALMWAASQRQLDAVDALLAGGADVHARSDTWKQRFEWGSGQDVHPDLIRWLDEGGYSALMFAAQSGDLPVARRLVEAGANVDDQTGRGISVTTMAIHSVLERDWHFPQQARVENRAAIGGLMASPHARPPNDSEELVEYLLEQGADPNASHVGYTALHAAILRRSERAVRALLAHGANPDAVLRVATPTRRDSFDFFFDPPLVGATPIWLAARFNQPHIMRILAEQGADPTFALHVEYWGKGNRELGWPRIVEGPTTLLMAALGMPDAEGYPVEQPRNRERMEALALETVRVGLELGVDPKVRNAAGRSAIDAARDQGYDSVVALLLSFKAGGEPIAQD